jgi:hypothetical protein
MSPSDGVEIPAPCDIPPREGDSREGGCYSINEQDQKLKHDADGEACAGIVRVVHVVAAVDVIDVNVVGVIPA